MNAVEFIRNKNAIPFEVLERYENKHVAWSEDGREIIASASSLPELFVELDRRGLKNYVVGFIPSFDESYLGGGHSE